MVDLMTLQEQHKMDILGLALGLGDKTSDRRARELVDTRPEAAGFLREMQDLKSAFGARIASQPEQILSPQEVDDLTARIQRRWEASQAKALPPKPAVPWWSRPIVGAAAALLLMVLPVSWLAVQRGPESTAGLTATLMFSASGGNLSGPVSRTEPLPVGTWFDSGSEQPMLVLAGRLRAAIDAHSRFQITQPQGVFMLEAGSAWIQAHKRSAVQMGPAGVTQEAGLVQYTTNGKQWRCNVVEGRVQISINGRSYQARAGESATWNEAANDLGIEQNQATVPAWVTGRLNPD